MKILADEHHACHAMAITVDGVRTSRIRNHPVDTSKEIGKKLKGSILKN